MNSTTSAENRQKVRREPLSWDEKLLIFAFPTLLLLAGTAQIFLGRREKAVLINFPPPAALPIPNGFDAYIAAEAAIKLDIPAVDPVDDSRKFMPTTAKMAAQKYSLANKTAWLRANSAGFTLFRAAQSLPCRNPWSSSLGRMGPSYVSNRALRQLARYKVIEINTLKLQKKWNGAVTSALDTLQMGNDIAIGGPYDAKYTGTAIEDLARAPLTTLEDPISQLSASQARAATKRLGNLLTRRFRVTQALEIERWAVLREFDFYSQQPNWQSQIAQNQGREPSWREKLGFLSNPKSQILKDINGAFDAFITDTKKPYNAPYTVFTAVNPLSQNFVYGRSYRFDEAREVVMLDLLLLRLTLQSFRAENGRFPATLNELAPRYLRQIPTDNFASGQPFHYSSQGQKYQLYSVGPDGKDDRGTPIEEKSINQRTQLGYLLLQPNDRGDYVVGINH